MKEPTVETLVTSDGYRHSYRHYRPAADRPKGYIVALHGIQSHSGWYGFSSTRLAESGFDLRFLDRRGSGLNEVERGHVRHQDRLINDVLHQLRDVRQKRNETAPAVPVVLLGVSWGGKLASVVASRGPELIDGLALLYPGIRAQVRATWWQNTQLTMAEAAEVLEKRVPIPLDDAELFTGQKEWQDYIRNDERSLHGVTVSFLLANRELDRELPSAARGIRCPVVMMLAGKDRIIDNAATTEWFEGLASQERRLIEYPDACHTLEFEPDRERFVSDLCQWLDDLGRMT